MVYLRGPGLSQQPDLSPPRLDGGDGETMDTGDDVSMAVTTPEEPLGTSAYWTAEYAEELTRSISVRVIYFKNMAVELKIWQQHMEAQWR